MVSRSKFGPGLLAASALALAACGADSPSERETASGAQGPGVASVTVMPDPALAAAIAPAASGQAIEEAIEEASGQPGGPPGGEGATASVPTPTPVATSPGTADPVPSPAPSRTPPDPALQAAMPDAAQTGAPTDALLADPAAHLQEALATGSDAGDTATVWFCTSTRDGRFVERTRWYLWENGLGRVGGDEVTWSAIDGRLVLASDSGATTSYADVTVHDRFVRADGFSAGTGADRNVDCELSGPPRSNGLFADDSDPRPLTTEEITGEGIDELLVTGRSASDTESFWSCTSSTGGVPVRSFDLRLFDTGEAYSGAPGNWAALDRSTLLLSFEGAAGGSTLVWEDVVIPYRPDQAFDRFVAADANEVDVACRWAGRSRT